jgi:hypothetical protein
MRLLCPDRRREMVKQLEKPQEIKVKANISGVPLSLTRNGHREKVAAIYEHWRVADEWWGNEVERDCFRIRTSAGLVCDIFRDTVAHCWYLSRVHD